MSRLTPYIHIIMERSAEETEQLEHEEEAEEEEEKEAIYRPNPHSTSKTQELNKPAIC